MNYFIKPKGGSSLNTWLEIRRHIIDDQDYSDKVRSSIRQMNVILVHFMFIFTYIAYDLFILNNFPWRDIGSVQLTPIQILLLTYVGGNILTIALILNQIISNIVIATTGFDECLDEYALMIGIYLNNEQVIADE